MKFNKRFIFWVLLFANIVLLAHSFVPHHHHNETDDADFISLIHSFSANNTQHDFACESCCFEKHQHNTRHLHNSVISALLSKLNLNSLIYLDIKKGFNPIFTQKKKAYTQFYPEFYTTVFLSTSNLRGPPFIVF